MSKNKGNIVFFIGVFIFVVFLVIGFVTEVSAVLIDVFMGIGLVIEFIGLCICYKKDKVQGIEKKEEMESLKEEKTKIKEEQLDDVVEVAEKKKNTVKKKTSSKSKTSAKKSVNKKSATPKKNIKKSK